jgi:hypothetical protein
MRCTLYGRVQLMASPNKRKFSQGTLNFGSKAPRTVAGASAGGEPMPRECKWDTRGDPVKSVLVRTRGTRLNEMCLPCTSTRVGAFDFDSTLVETKSGAKWPASADDWRLFNAHVTPQLQRLHDEGYRFVCSARV